jgi:hypothetical protein
MARPGGGRPARLPVGIVTSFLSSARRTCPDGPCLAAGLGEASWRPVLRKAASSLPYAPRPRSWQRVAAVRPLPPVGAFYAVAPYKRWRHRCCALVTAMGPTLSPRCTQWALCLCCRPPSMAPMLSLGGGSLSPADRACPDRSCLAAGLGEPPGGPSCGRPPAVSPASPACG